MKPAYNDKLIMRMTDGFGGFDHMSCHVAVQRDRSKWKWSPCVLGSFEFQLNGHEYTRYGNVRLPNEGDYPDSSCLTGRALLSFLSLSRNFEFLWCSNGAPSLLETTSESIDGLIRLGVGRVVGDDVIEWSEWSWRWVHLLEVRV